MVDNYTETFEGCIGIDLGTTYSCVGVWVNDRVEIIPNSRGNRVTPSYISFTDTDRVVGESAKALAVSNPYNTVFDVKRLMGQRCSDGTVMDEMDHLPYTVSPDEYGFPNITVKYKNEKQNYKPEQLSAMILSEMKTIAETYLQMKVRRAVITVPAYFNDSQRSATKAAATIAGLECMRIINEPTAACLCYGINKNHDGSNVLVFDLGGGTFDVSILTLSDGLFEVKSTNGNTHLGGEDFDYCLMEHFLKLFLNKHRHVDRNEIMDNGRSMRKLRNACEKIKIELSRSNSSQYLIESLYDDIDYNLNLTRATFDHLCSASFNKCLEPIRSVLHDAEMTADDIDDIVLVGGSTRIPSLQRKIQEFFGGKDLNKSINPDESVAYGAAIQGTILTHNDTSGKTKDILLLDVIPLSVGIETRGGQMCKIVDRNATVPMSKDKMFTTSEDRQNSVLIKIFQGERAFTIDNHLLGTFELTDIPLAPKGVTKIKVSFDIDENGIISVRAEDNDTGIGNDISINPDTGRLSQEEINAMIKNAETFKADDVIKKESIIAREKFEKYLYNVQVIINDPEYSVDEMNVKILNEKEYTFVNQYLLNTFAWINENEGIDRDTILESMSTVEKTLKDILYKIYSRQGQIKLREEIVSNTTQHKLSDQEVLNTCFGNDNTVDNDGNAGNDNNTKAESMPEEDQIPSPFQMQ